MASSTSFYAILFFLSFSLLIAFSLSLENSNTEGAKKPLRQLFNKWKLRHVKNYGTPQEEEFRFQVFRNHFLYVRNHNQKSHSSFKLSLNAFSDLTSQEFTKLMNGYNSTLAAPMFANSKNQFRRDPSVSLPGSVDWRNEGAVTGVKNQGQCGGCWSFSATGAIEGQWALAGNSLVGLSEQNLLDCSRNGGNDGCNGGLMPAAFEYVISNNGIDTESSYPYQAEGPLQCRYRSANKGATISSYSTVTSGNEPDLEAAVASVGPVSVGIDASHSSFQSYSGGVYYEPACSSTNLDHGVLVVGYGTTSAGEDYWIVKNSWGTSWGIQGYIWMARNQGNNCGIATQASYPQESGGGGGGGSSSGYSTGTVQYYSTNYPSTSQ